MIQSAQQGSPGRGLPLFGDPGALKIEALHLSASLADAERISALLVAERASPSATCLRELIWLRAVFLGQLARTPIAERRRFSKRADCIIEQLAASMILSEARNSVAHHDKP